MTKELLSSVCRVLWESDALCNARQMERKGIDPSLRFVDLISSLHVLILRKGRAASWIRTNSQEQDSNPLITESRLFFPPHTNFMGTENEGIILEYSCRSVTSGNTTTDSWIRSSS